MFPEKINITDDLIKLIIDTRKEHNLTAYQLSEKIGKNKSWLPNIENKRTKKISKNDLYLLFKSFADEEHLNPEQYIVLHLPRNTIIELEDGVTAPCFHVRQMLNVDYLEDYVKLSIEEQNKESHFDCYGRSDSLKQKDILSSIYRLSSTLKNNLKCYTLGEQEKFSKMIDQMTDNFTNDFVRTINIYNESYCPEDPLEYDTKVKQVYLDELDVLQESISVAINFISSKAFIYSFIEETPSDTYRFFDKIRNWDSLPDEEDEKLYFALEDIKNYQFGVFICIEYYEQYLSTFKSTKKLDYHLIFSKLHEMFTLYIKVAKINYTFNMSIPDNSISHKEIEELHRQTDKILFNIEKEVRLKYKNRNSWCFS